MKRIAVFGNAGGGKSRLARQLAAIMGLPLHSIDKLKFPSGRAELPHVEFLKAHAEILKRDKWIIDGYGCSASSWDRFARADTLIYIDLPLTRHRWWVAKRLIKGLFSTPEGWPQGSPLWRSTLSSYKVIGLCHSHLTPKYRNLVIAEAASKRVYHLKSPADIRAFLNEVVREHGQLKSASQGP